MALNPYMLTVDRTFTWDNVTVRLQRGTVIDTPNGGGLYTAIGGGNLVSLTAQQVSDTDGITIGQGTLPNLVGAGQTPYNPGQN